MCLMIMPECPNPRSGCPVFTGFTIMLSASFAHIVHTRLCLGYKAPHDTFRTQQYIVLSVEQRQTDREGPDSKPEAGKLDSGFPFGLKPKW